MIFPLSFFRYLQKNCKPEQFTDDAVTIMLSERVNEGNTKRCFQLSISLVNVSIPIENCVETFTKEIVNGKFNEEFFVQ